MEQEQELKIILELIATDKDFISSKKFNNSLELLLKRYPDGCPNYLIASCLMITEEEVEARYNNIIELIQDILDI